MNGEWYNIAVFLNFSTPREVQTGNNFITAKCGNLVSLLPRIFIFLFYQLQFLKSIFFIMMDKNLKETITNNMFNVCHNVNI